MSDMLDRVYGLEMGADLHDLEGCTIESITVSNHQVQLHFDSLRNISVAVERDFAVAAAGREPAMFDSPRLAAQMLAERIGATVANALVGSPATLTLRLDDGSTIEIYDSEERYESYQITIGERLIVV